MSIDETLLTIIALSIELGLPIVLIVYAVKSARLRRYAVSILGAVTPLLAVYFFLLIDFIINGTEEGTMGIGAIWIMSFFVYCLLVFTGVIVGLLYPSKNNNYVRYAVAFIFGPAVGYAFIGFEQVIA